jgi:Septum formation
MSTEASEDSKPDMVDEVEREAPTSESTEPGESTMASEKVAAGESTDASGLIVADGAGEEAGQPAHPVADDAAAGQAADSAAAAEEDEADGHGGFAEIDEFIEIDEYDGYDADGDADEQGDLIERAEPVELDEPAAALRPPRRWWPRLLIALGFVIVAAAIIGGAIAIVGSVTHGFKKPVKVTYKKSALFSLKTGNCFNSAGQAYTLIPCDSPHQAEVFATFALANGAWPGNTAVAAAASSGCKSRLTGYLNPQLAISLASTYVYPDATAWQAGTRTVICEVRSPSGDLTGSVRGATATAG